MNTSSHQLHTSYQGNQKREHSHVQKLAAISSVVAVLNAGMPAPLSSASTHKIMDDTAGKAMTFVPPASKVETNATSSKTEANTINARAILVKYTIQPGDTLGTLACVFGVTVENFMKYNPQITNKNIIYAEDTLIVPNPTRNIAKCVIDVRGETKDMGDLKEKRTPVVGTQEPLSPEDFKKTFLADSTNVKMLAKYVKLHNMKAFQEIKNAHISKAEKQRRLFDVYKNEHADFTARAYVQEVKNFNPDKQVVENVETLLKDAGYTITAKDFLEAKMWTESSGGRAIGAIAEAQKLMRLYNEATLPKVKEKYETKIASTIKTAISWIVGPSNDVGPYGMRPGWVKAEQLNGWNPGTELKINNDVNVLRQGVKKIFINAVRENLSQKELIDQLIGLDSRFDGQLMGDAALFSFQRITSNLTKEQGLTPEQAVKGANIDYNKGEGTTKRILQKKGHVVSTRYSDKMDITLKLMTAFNNPQIQTTTQGKAPTKTINKNLALVKHGIDPNKVGGGVIEKDPITGTPLCSRTARNGLLKSGANPEKVDQDDAIKLMHRWLKTKKGKSFDNQAELKSYLISRAKKGKVLGDMTMDTPDGHRAYSFFGIDEKLYVSDIYRGDKKAPMLFDDYMAKNLGKSFTRVVVNTHVGKIYNPSAKFVVNIQKEPTPMPIIMASAPAGTVPVMVQSDGVYKLSQGISASVVKLTDTTTRDNHLQIDMDIGDDKMLFPALSSARIRNRIDLIRAQIDILTSNVTDPIVKKRIEKKLGENPAWTMTQNIKLQKTRYMKGGDVQALKNAKGLYALLIMCEQELAKMPAFNKMAA